MELPFFILLGIVANAWLPLPPFEPVLLAFAHTRPLEPALMVAVVGSLSAAIGEGVGRKRQKVPPLSRKPSSAS